MSQFSDCFSFMELETGVTNTDLALGTYAESEFHFDTSNGYLGDVIALAGYDILRKEQKLPSCSREQKVDQSPRFCTTAELLQNCGFTHDEELITTNLSSSPQGATNKAAIKRHPSPSNYTSEGQRKKIAYPFKLVKSGGVEGETTLKDINNQIVTTPSTSKPIPHPVKDSETRPCKLARCLTGKAVTSRTMIQTRGRGSITIIRTKD